MRPQLDSRQMCSVMKICRHSNLAVMALKFPAGLAHHNYCSRYLATALATHHVFRATQIRDIIECSGLRSNPAVCALPPKLLRTLMRTSPWKSPCFSETSDCMT